MPDETLTVPDPKRDMLAETIARLRKLTPSGGVINEGFAIFADGRRFEFGAGKLTKWSMSVSGIRKNRRLETTPAGEDSVEQGAALLDLQLVFLDERDRPVVVNKVESASNTIDKWILPKDDTVSLYSILGGQAIFPDEEEPGELLCAVFYVKRQEG